MAGDSETAAPVRLAEAAFKLMSLHGVTPTPQNYTVWYTYAAHSMPGLNHTVDELLSKQVVFDDEISGEIYRRYFGWSDRHFELHEAGGRIQVVIDQLRRYLGDHTGEVDSFGHQLTDFTAAIRRSQPLEKLRELVADLVSETETMAQRNRSLESRLGEVAGQVDELRDNLEAVRREALTDALTGIPNRKFFDERLKEAAREALSENEPVSLVLGDIDHFKRFNDTFGHQVGDQVLRLVARTMSDQVKGRDTPARFGGEEFAIILPRTNLQQGVIVADQVRNAIMRRKFVSKATGDDYGRLTLSFGVAEYRPNESLDELIRRADTALYHAKREGRNRVATETQAGTAIPRAS